MREQELEQQVISATDRWIRDNVVGLDLCPFAAHAVDTGRIVYQVSHNLSTEALYQDLLHALDNLQCQDEAVAGTGLLILSRGLPEFERYMEFLDLIEASIDDTGLRGIIQIASFHPRYRFADSEEDDPANYTNRSPYPMFHMIREDELESALATHPDPDAIPQRNISLLREMGLKELQQRLSRCLQV